MRISNRCYAVTGLGYSTPWCVNAGIITGEEATLIVDTGANTLAAQTIFGYASAVGAGKPIRVINTEQHFDHIGGNSFFRAQGIDVWGHRAIARTPEEFQAEIEEFNAAIPNTARKKTHEADVFFDATTLANPNCPIDGDSRMFGVEILMTPGHTRTNLSVWVPEDRVLFTGDCLIAKYLPNLDAGVAEHWRIWLESLDRIEALRPLVVVAGHGPVAQGDEVSRIIARVRRVLEESIERGHSPTCFT